MTRLLALLLLTALPSGAAGPNPRLASLGANTALDLGRYTCNQPADNPTNCESITDYSRLIYDRFNHQMLMFGGGHSATHRTDVDVFHFDTLAWSSAYPSTRCADMRLRNRGLERSDWVTTGHPIARHTYDMLVIPDSTRRLLLLNNTTGQGGCVEPSPRDQELYFLAGKIAAYDPVAKRWTYTKAPNNAWMPYGSAEYDPVSGLVVIIDYKGIWTYDPVKEKVSRHMEFAGDMSEKLGWGNNLVYFPPNQKMYYFADGKRVFEISLKGGIFSGGVTMLSVTGDPPKLEENSGFAYDSVNRIIGGAVANGVFYAFDPATKRWTKQTIQTEPPGRAVGTLAHQAIDYSPEDNVFIFISDYNSGRHTWAYRYARPASGAEAPPSR
jgi:hypothetical protein